MYTAAYYFFTLLVVILQELIRLRDQKPFKINWIELIEKDTNMSKLRYKVNLPSVSAPDLAILLLEVVSQSENDSTKEIIDVLPGNTPDQDQVVEILVDEGYEVTLTLLAADDVGNEARSAPFTFVATDTIPPKINGEISNLVLLAEEYNTSSEPLDV